MERTISISSEVNKSVHPDYAEIRLNVSEEAKTYEEAINSVSAKVKEITDLMASVGLDAKEVKTDSYNVNIQYEYTRGLSKIISKRISKYVCRQNLTVTFDLDSEKLTKTVEAITTTIADPGMEVKFFIKDEQAIKDALLREVGKNAKAKAELLCESVGAKLGPLVKVDCNRRFRDDCLYSLAMPCSRMTEMTIDGVGEPEPPSVHIQPVDIDVSASADFVWEIIG